MEAFDHRVGALGGGNDVEQGSFTFEDACAHCKKLPHAVGFTFRSPQPKPGSKVTCYFKSSADGNSDASWQTYLQKKPAVVRKKGPAAKREPASPRAKAKAGGGAMSEGIPKVCHICKGSGTAPAPAPQPAAVAPRDEEPYKRLASQAWFLASKVSAGVYEVDTYTAEICRGVPVMGARARGPLKKYGYREKMNLYTSESLVPIISDNHLLLHDTNLEDWKGAFTTYASMTRCGVVILCGTLAGFQTWATSQPCLNEVAAVDDGRLFAYVRHPRSIDPNETPFLLDVNPQAQNASASVENGKGMIVWHDGSYYVGDILRGQEHGCGEQHWPNGDVYVGPYVEAAKHGEGLFTWADGNWMVAEWKQGVQGAVSAEGGSGDPKPAAHA